MRFKRLFGWYGLLTESKEDVEEVKRVLKGLGYSIKEPSKGNVIAVLCNPGEDRRDTLGNILEQLSDYGSQFEEPNHNSSIGSVKLNNKVIIVVKNTPGAGRTDSNTDMNELLQMYSAFMPDAKDLNDIEDSLRVILDSSIAERLIRDIEDRRSTLEGGKNSWVDTFIKTGQLLRDEIKNVNEFTCFRTGSDYVTDNNPYKVRYNRIIQDLLTKTKLGGNKPDNLNPADIIFIKDPEKVLGTMEEKLSLLSPNTDVNVFYSDWKLMWFRFFEEGLFYPISLKKLSGNGHIEYNNEIKPKEQKEIEELALNLELEKIKLAFDFKEITSKFVIRRTSTDSQGQNEISAFVFQSRAQSGGTYSNIACDTYIEGKKAQLGKIKTAVKKLCPELNQDVAKRFGSKKDKLSKVSSEMLKEWQKRLGRILAFEKDGITVIFNYKDNLRTVQEMFEYAMNGTDEEKGMFVLYMQTIDYFFGILCDNGDLNGRLADMINIALKNTGEVSFFIKIS